MEVIYGIRCLRKHLSGPKVVAIGTFDGVHTGHKKLLGTAVKLARSMKGTCVVLTFAVHPRSIVNPRKSPPLLTSLEHKLDLLAATGADICLVAKPGSGIFSLSAEEFVQDILVNNLGVSMVVVGFNYSFGKGRTGNTALLKRMGKRLGFGVRVVRAVRVAGVPVSSTRIRLLIERGRLREASRLLGREFSIMGTVVKGSGWGRKLGCPTANIDPHHEAMPPEAVYAVKAKVKGRTMHGVLNIGVIPSFKRMHGSTNLVYPGRANKPEKTIEVHIFGFHKNIYGKTIEVIFVRRMRDEKKFSTASELAEQLKQDERTARKILLSV
jgi:riboflavin kinase/FMN adenylyltransferase